MKLDGAVVGEVQDDSFVRGYAAASLETLDYRVVIATNGREALSFLF